jgi:formamidopyrimidine-DNA glycosylase
VPGTGEAHPLLARLGPEPFDPAFDAGYLWTAPRRRGAAIKLALMDNHLVVGVGNIYANEALFRAGIRPTTPAHRLSRARLGRLVQTVRETLTDAIAKGGSTLRDYVDSDGEPGYFQLDYFVYGREGEPCRVCGAPIRMKRLSGRATSWCPRCQR